MDTAHTGHWRRHLEKKDLKRRDGEREKGEESLTPTLGETGRLGGEGQEKGVLRGAGDRERVSEGQGRENVLWPEGVLWGDGAKEAVLRERGILEGRRSGRGSWKRESG